MEAVELTKNISEWDKFCLTSDGAWFWHTTGWMDYTLNYQPQLNSRSSAFMVVENGKLMAAVPLMIEEHTYNGGQRFFEFSFGGASCWSAALANGLSPKKRDDVIRFVFDYIDKLARANNIARVSLKISPLIPSFWEYSKSFIVNSVKFGYVDISLATSVIDLGLPVDQLWRNLSEGHRRNVNKGIRSGINTCFFDQDEIDFNTFEKYRVMHHKAAGRATRPPITFKMMYDWVMRRSAVLFAAKKGETFIGFSYVIVYKDGAYYGSGANDPDYPKEPLGHVLHWQAIKWLKSHGYRYYEMGLQQYRALPYDFPSEKELTIARFKRGFGGGSVPLLIREKYCSPELYRLVNTERMGRYYAMVGAKEEKDGQCLGESV